LTSYSNFRTRLIVNELLQGCLYGVLIVVQALVFIEKGIPAWQMGYFIGTMGIVAVVLEVPFGALADRVGRIKTYRFAIFVLILSGALLLWGTHWIVLLIGIIGSGAAKALESGTYSAWYVERLNENGWEDKTEKLTGQLQATAALGLMIGAIGGGYLPDILGARFGFSGTEWNLLAFLVLNIVHLPVTYLVFGAKPEAPHEHEAVSFGAALNESLKNRAIKEVLLLGLLVGFIMAPIETYWQPRYIEIVPDTEYSIFGWITFGYFAMAIIGPILIGVIAEKVGLTTRWQVRVVPVIAAISVLVLGLAQTQGTFLGGYFGFMLFFSMAGPALFTMLNDASSDQVRATMQSVSSLTFTLGGALAAYGLPSLIRVIGIGDTLALTAAVCGGALAVLALINGQKDRISA